MELEKDREYTPPASVSTATSFSVVNPVGDEEKKIAAVKKRNNIIKIAVVAVAAFAIYKYYKK